MKRLFFILLLAMTFGLAIGCCGKYYKTDIQRILTPRQEVLQKSSKSVVKILGKSKVVVDIKTSTNSQSEYFEGMGSGVIIKHGVQSSYILTAGHVCHILRGSDFFEGLPPEILKILEVKVFSTFKVLTQNEEAKDATIFALHPKLDLCILQTFEKLDSPTMKIAKHMPDLGRKYYNLAFPKGIGNVGLVPIFEGYFVGYLYNPMYNEADAGYTIPADGGSSGSPVINEFGEILGIIHSIRTGFHHFVLTSTLHQIQNFVQENLQNS